MKECLVFAFGKICNNKKILISESKTVIKLKDVRVRYVALVIRLEEVITTNRSGQSSKQPPKLLLMQNSQLDGC